MLGSIKPRYAVNFRKVFNHNGVYAQLRGRISNLNFELPAAMSGSLIVRIAYVV